MNLVERAKKIILEPKTEWGVIAGEQPNIGQIFMGYVLPLALIPTIASIIGFGLVGRGGFTSFSYGLAMAIVQLISAFFVVYLAAFVIDFLAPNFGSQKNLGRAVQLVAYSYTPAWVAGIFNIIPALSWIVILASLYSLYLLYLGLAPTMKTPQDKVVVYLVVSIIVLIIVYAVIGAILSLIILGLFGLSALSSAAMGM
jgi:hypothetical protein